MALVFVLPPKLRVGRFKGVCRGYMLVYRVCKA